jgi:post-segregation antitoxin (ccd killing protein)
MKGSREKLSRSRGLRFAPSVAERLSEQARAAGVDEGELARHAVEVEIMRREDTAALREVARLRAAGIDLKALVDLALAKKALEDAQVNLPGFFSQGRLI